MADLPVNHLLLLDTKKKKKIFLSWSAAKWVLHAIPVIVLLCFFLLWWFSYHGKVEKTNIYIYIYITKKISRTQFSLGFVSLLFLDQGYFQICLLFWVHGVDSLLLFSFSLSYIIKSLCEFCIVETIVYCRFFFFFKMCFLFEVDGSLKLSKALIFVKIKAFLFLLFSASIGSIRIKISRIDIVLLSLIRLILFSLLGSSKVGESGWLNYSYISN